MNRKLFALEESTYIDAIGRDTLREINILLEWIGLIITAMR